MQFRTPQGYCGACGSDQLAIVRPCPGYLRKQCLACGSTGPFVPRRADEAPRQDNEHRNPYVGAGVSGARRSAQIDRDELDTLASDDPRRELLAESARRWDRQADELADAAARLNAAMQGSVPKDLAE